MKGYFPLTLHAHHVDGICMYSQRVCSLSSLHSGPKLRRRLLGNKTKGEMTWGVAWSCGLCPEVTGCTSPRSSVKIINWISWVFYHCNRWLHRVILSLIMGHRKLSKTKLADKSNKYCYLVQHSLLNSHLLSPISSKASLHSVMVHDHCSGAIKLEPGSSFSILQQ